VTDRPKFTLSIVLTDQEGSEVVKESAYCDSLYGVCVELGSPRGFTGQRFLDAIDATFLRGAKAPLVTFESKPDAAP
jgi:hypothetical protein